MKNNYLIAFLAASMALAGCSKSEVIGSEEPIARHSIDFSTYANESKALPITGNTGGTNNFQKENNAFGVTAFFNTVEEPYMGAAALGTQIKYTTTPKSAWIYANPEDVCFWPATTGSTDKLRFYAYAPFTSANTTAPVAPAFSNTTDKWMKFTDYTVPADVTKQDDFMYATAEAIVLSTANQSVKLAFAHALTQIHFAARTQATNLKVEIAENGIKMCKIGSVGTFTLTPASTPSAAWSTIIGTPIDYTIPSDATATPIGYHATDYAAIDKATVNVLMLIPQTTTAWDPKTATTTAIIVQTGSYFSINCKIYQQNGTTGAKTYLHGTAVADGYAMLYVPFAANWTMAQSVTYQLTFGGGYDDKGNPILNPITFTTDVTGWGNNTNITQ